ncbi:MAG: PAS domain-containing sensor histidine kinase [Ignavibacteriae bacterium]|nr:PAS domain-containing sensor histidine kinase [Ignavibacteriota bacterium]
MAEKKKNKDGVPVFSGTKDELLKRYSELQLRVTRFSAVEQELINTRNRLDIEITMHRRMHSFNKSAFVDITDAEFAKLAAEAIVDIFEVEAGLVIAGYTDMSEIPVFGVEGINVDVENYPRVFSMLGSLFESESDGNVLRFESSAFDSLKPFLPFSRAYGVRYYDTENSISLIILGGITVGGSLLYDPLDKDREIIFNVFAQQVLAQAVTRRKNRTILQHSERIDKLGERLSRITESFLNFGTNPKDNIYLLVKLCAEMMNSELFTYYYLEDDNLKKIGTCGEDTKSCNYCENIFKRYSSNNFRNFRYEDIETLRTEFQCRLSIMKSCLGCAVTLENETVGVLEIVYSVDYVPTENDRQIMEIIAAAIAVEERRNISIKALEEGERRYRMIFEGTPHGILIAEVESAKFRYANQSICNMLGYDKSEILNLGLTDIHPPDSIEKVINHFSSMASGTSKSAYEIPFVKKDGSVIFADIASYNLKHGKTELVAAFITDITARKNATEDLIRNNVELKKINSELDNFVYSITHDLRAPLLAMKGLLNLISYEDGNATLQKKYLNLVDESATRLDDNIQEILEYSRNSRLELKYEEIDLRDMVKNIYESLRYYHIEEMDLQMDIENGIRLVSDRFRINTLLKNIITNSVKYRKHSDEKSFVKVTCKKIKNKISITVRDNGEGIPEKHIGKIFDMFIRISNTTPGTGLGLYICREIVTKLGGTISVKSEEGKYTEFLIIIDNINTINNIKVIKE